MSLTIKIFMNPQTSAAVTVASAGFVAANAFGLFQESLAPTTAVSIATPQETIAAKASNEAVLAPRKEEEGVVSDDSDVAEKRKSVVTEKKEEQAEEKSLNAAARVAETKEIPAAVSASEKVSSAEDVPALIVETVEEKSRITDSGEASGAPPIATETLSESVTEEKQPELSAAKPSESVFDDLMRKMELAGKVGIDGVEVENEKVADEIISAKPAETVKEMAKSVESSDEIDPLVAKSADSVFDDLLKKMDTAGKAGADGIEAAKEKMVDAMENAADALTAAGKDLGSVVEEATDEKGGMAVAAGVITRPKLQVSMPDFSLADFKNLDPIAAQGAAVLTFGAIAAAAVIAATEYGGSGSTFAPGTKSKGAGYLDGLTRSSATLASKGSKGPTSYLDTLKTSSSAMSSAKTGAGAGASYLDVISPKSSGAKKSYSVSGKKPIKTGSSDSLVKKQTPSGSYKAAPASKSLSQPSPPTVPSPKTVATAQQAAPVSTETVAEPAAPPSPSTLSYVENMSSGSTAAPKKTYSPFGSKPTSTVGAGSMGSSSSYLSNMSTRESTFVSSPIEPSWSPAAPASTSSSTTASITSQVAPKASYSPFGNTPRSKGTTGAMGSSSSYLSGMGGANGASVSYSTGPSLPPPSASPASYTTASQAAPKTSYNPFGGGKPNSTSGAGIMGSSTSYLTGMGTNGANGDSQSQPVYPLTPPPSPSPPPSVEPVSQSYAGSSTKSYAPMKGKPRAVARVGPGSYLDAL